MTLKIDNHVYEAMLAAAHKAAPLEACGLLGGIDGRATKFYELTNADHAAEHYSMLPEEQFAAVKDMRQSGLRMVAVWHSHPATPARMSDEDLRLAFTPNVVYVILSLNPGRTEALAGFRVHDGVPVKNQVDIVHE